MPFQSDQQRRYLYSQKPEVAERISRDSKKGKHGLAKALDRRRKRKRGRRGARREDG